MIYELPHPVLRLVCSTIKRVDKELLAVLDTMVEIMEEEQGCGLAANQVGTPLRMFVAKLSTGTHKFINPVFQTCKSRMIEGVEGCLSLPDLTVKVIRRNKIRLTYWSVDGSLVDGTFAGQDARVIQHEMDHLDGVLLIDKDTNNPVVRDYVDTAARVFAKKILKGEVQPLELNWLKERYC